MTALTSIVLVYSWHLSLLLSKAKCNIDTKSPRVAISSGCVEGVVQMSALGRPFFAFKGIPYAAPPIGELRFKAPRPPISWLGVLQAVKDSPACLQPWRQLSFPITYSEDCLYLNVYTPYLQHPQGNLMPVIVWIHGGKFYQGSGTSYHYGPDFLLMKDVVVVSFNYRLGVFGYLNMNISEAQGNAASKDKVAALKWVKNEISKFGGDPNLVTIFGGSSGGTDVSLLYISPMAKGLFNRAISNSGAALCTWSFLSSTVSHGLKLAEYLNCPSQEPQAAVSCLRSISATQLAEKQMFDSVEGFDNPFVPSIEADLGEEVFLSDSPQNLITQAGQVPYIIGLNSGEGLMYIADPSENPNQFTEFEEDLFMYLPADIKKNRSQLALQNIVSRIKDFYLGSNPSLNDTMYGFVNYMSDKKFSFGVLKTAEVISTRAPVYLYYFTFEGDFQRKDHAANKLNLSGVCHGEELPYLFYRNYSIAAHNNISAHPRDMALVEKMIDLWTNFAVYGNPTPIIHEYLNKTWEPVIGTFTRHLLIGDSLEMAERPLLKERELFWENLYSLLEVKECPVSEERNYVTLIATLFIFFVALIIGAMYLYRHVKQKRYCSI